MKKLKRMFLFFVFLAIFAGTANCQPKISEKDTSKQTTVIKQDTTVKRDTTKTVTTPPAGIVKKDSVFYPRRSVTLDGSTKRLSSLEEKMKTVMEKLNKIDMTYEEIRNKQENRAGGDATLKQNLIHLEAQLEEQNQKLINIINLQIKGILVIALAILIFFGSILFWSWRKMFTGTLPAKLPRQSEIPEPIAQTNTIPKTDADIVNTDIVKVMNKLENTIIHLSEQLSSPKKEETKFSVSPEDIYKLKDMGYTNEEIAKELQIEKGRVALILNLKNKGTQKI